MISFHHRLVVLLAAIVGLAASANGSELLRNSNRHLSGEDSTDDSSSDDITPNPFMLKLKIGIADLAAFKAGQEALCQVMAEDHPGVLTYHVDYPVGENFSEWTEIYANDLTFIAHLANPRAQGPLNDTLSASNGEIECRAWGNPNEASREILAGFGCVYQDTGINSFVLNPIADINSAE